MNLSGEVVSKYIKYYNINLDDVLIIQDDLDMPVGRYKLFVELYKPFIEPEMLDTLERIEKYTLEHSEIEDTSIIEQNNVSYDIKDNRFALPDFNPITDKMMNRLTTIKNNNYLLPVAEDPPEQHKKIIHPLIFF